MRAVIGRVTTTDALGNKTTAAYDYNAGKVSTVKDVRGNTTRYSYADGFDRLTQIIEPSGAQTNNAYPTPYWTVSYYDQTSPNDRTMESQVVYDGFGRKIEDRQYVDTQDIVAIDRTYDAMGRVACTYNLTKIYIPTWTSDGYNYATCYGYDSLSRATVVNTPDGATAATSYSGNSTTAPDAVGKATKTVSDALGRVCRALGISVLAATSAIAVLDWDPLTLMKVTIYSLNSSGSGFCNMGLILTRS